MKKQNRSRPAMVLLDWNDFILLLNNHFRGYILNDGKRL